MYNLKSSSKTVIESDYKAGTNTDYETRSIFHYSSKVLFKVHRFIPPSLKNNLKRIRRATKIALRSVLPTSIKVLYREYQLARQQKQRCKALREKLIANYSYDFERFWQWSTVAAGSKLSSDLLTADLHLTQENLKALITKDYHRIEKALALREPRTAFGQDTIKALVLGIEKYQHCYGGDETVQIALNTLISYYNFNLERGHDDKHLFQTIMSLKSKTTTEDGVASHRGGVLKLRKEQTISEAKMDLRAFFASRHSIRNFSNEEVEMGLIEQAVEMAQKTPSVCNRQSSRVYIFCSDEDKKRVLNYQNGNRGFGDQINKVLLVTSDLQNFLSVGERNQCWIDGGMYAMSIIYALHSLGLGTCCLNWSVDYQMDQKLKKAAGIRDSEAVIMMIAVGHLPDEFMVAQSPRKKVHEVLTIK